MDRIERKILEIIEQNKEAVMHMGRDIYEHAEMGFREYRTTGQIGQALEDLGISCQKGLAVTGIKGYLKPVKEQECTIAVIGEMDALPISDHTYTNPETGAAHACGHNAQIAALYGAAMALCDPEVKESLGGNVAFMAVPSEEFVDTEFKKQLMDQNIIQYAGGKSELIRIGAFDDISIAVGHHILPEAEGFVLANGSTNGFVNKITYFHGKAAHAAGAPEKGRDALNAAMLAIHAIDIQRETFRDEDSVRIHSFLPRAGEAMNIIAEHTCIESSVRAKNIKAIREAAEKYDRSMRAGAIGLGCNAEIITLPGYLPTVPLKDPSLMSQVLVDLSEEEQRAGRNYPVEYRNADFHEAGSTDFGEVSSILPLYQFRTGGYKGELHNTNISVEDEQLAYVEPAKIFALTVYRMLKDHAAEAKKIVEAFEPVMTKQQYFDYMQEMSKTERI